MSGIIIAIDGFSACGKSTLAKQVASHFGYLFIDSGAMYRAITLYALQEGLIDGGNLDQAALIQHLPRVSLEFKNIRGQQRIYLNGQDVEDEIRKGEVLNYVSPVATIREVREKLVKEQRAMARQGAIVMDGRDIGTVVFPEAELKIYVTASLEVRTQRRFDELSKKGVYMDKNEISKNLCERDRIDTSRLESPLKKADDAIVLDNTNLTKEQQLQWIIPLVDLALSKSLS
ncbi:MAG: (d)CMP kinase [Bacteroidetes bacterium]|nr:(d)CMP kinase [Bacteroidota bacterium]